MRIALSILALLAVATVSFLGVRGKVSKEPPVQIFDDMDNQPKLDPQGVSSVFADGSAARPAVPGSVPRATGLEPAKILAPGFRRAESLNPEFLTGKDASGTFLASFPKLSLTQGPDGKLLPYKIDVATLELGRKKYEIFCAVCHGSDAAGNGILKARATIDGAASMPTISNLQTQLFRSYPAGQLYDVVANGKNTMQPYGDYLTPEERWAVVAYLRALQLSQAFPPELTPASVKDATK